MFDLNQKLSRMRKVRGAVYRSPGCGADFTIYDPIGLGASRIHGFQKPIFSALARATFGWERWGFLGIVLILLFCATAARAQVNGIYHEIYRPLGGSSLQSLTNNSSFPGVPAFTPDIINDIFETPVNLSDQYGQRLRALIVPPVTGTYVFWISADQTGALFLSTDESPYNKTQIAFLTNSVTYRAWYTRPIQQSANILLEAGRRYYIEALHVSYNGIRDTVGVGWKLPDGTLEQPIPASRLWPYGAAAVSPPSLTKQPTNVTVLENAPATFRVGISNLDAVTYQWQRNNTNLPGALGASYTIPFAGTNDNGATFRCIVSNSVAPLTSSSALLTVTPDNTPPALFNVANLNSNTVQVIFSEPIEPASGTNITNYFINNGVTITSARLGASTRTINLSTSLLLPGGNYTLTINNVRDLAAARNVLAPNSQQTFTALLKGIYREVFAAVPGSLISDLTNNPAFPGNPTTIELMTNVFETTTNGNNYGQRMRALIIPPVNGNYTFWISATENATLVLGTNATAGSARQIASATTASQIASRQWDVQTNQRSAAISLVAGQQYYLEVLMKEGISSLAPRDHLEVRWQLPDGSFEEPISVARCTPVGMYPPLIALQPANASVVEFSPVTFSVAVSNLDALTYQWKQNGTNIPGATNASYTSPSVQLADNNSIFQCFLGNALGSTNTIGALLTVTPDVTPPAIVNALNNSSNRVVVYFSEPVEGLTATNPGNYGIPGIVISAPVLSGDGRSVTLTTTPLTSGIAYTLTVNGVRDVAATPNTIAANSQWTFLAGDFFPQDIGAPPLPGSMTPAQNGLDIVASGSGTSGASDQFNFTWEQRRFDFDVKVRVQRLDFADPWTSAGLMVRTNLASDTAFAGVFTTPSVAGTFFQYRTNVGGIAQTAGSFPVNFPDTWLRLQKTNGTRFIGYASYDGRNWTQLGSVFLQWPATVFLGFAVSSHNGSQTTLAQFRDFSDVTEAATGVVPVTFEPLGPSSRRTSLAISEIMYHPAPRTDGRNVEFIEIYNSNPYYEDISGFRISGDVDYVFPAGTIMPGGGFIVVAHNPADIQAVYGLSGVMGPYTHSLSNKKGTVRLRNSQDVPLLELDYDSRPPWPVAPDGSGHSLVLARASYGEADPRAWDQSDKIGGSPGRGDGFHFEPVRNVVINEFLAHTDIPDVDYIELYNHSTVPVDLSGCWLSDDPATNKYRIPDGTMIGPTGFVYFTETTMGFSLSAEGEAIYFVNSNLTRVVDSILFEAQENGVSVGRVPDGGPALQRLAAKTPGIPNGAIRSKSIVINEIMYHPISEDDNDQFVEIYNRGTNSVSLGNWQFTSGINFTFPSNTVLAANGYLVVARNAAHLITNYNNLNANNTLSNFTGNLSHGGERLALGKPDLHVTTNIFGVAVTNTIYPVVDEVTYQKGGRWGNWSAGGGSSLELIDPHSDNRLPSNWADSDETAKGQWTTLSATGTMDNAAGSQSDWNSLQFYMLDAGECLIDTVSVKVNNGTNIVFPNSTFDVNGLSGWIAQGDHRATFLDSTGDAGTAHSLHIVASDRGDDGGNRVSTTLASTYTTNNLPGTIQFRARWLRGTPYMVARLRGNHLEVPGVLNVPHNLGTPGQRNSRWVTNAGPAITEVTPNPILPAAGQPVVISARVHDPDGVASVQLVWHLDVDFAPVNTIAMVDDGTGGDAIAGDGVYSATLPGQANDATAVFYVQAADRFTPAATNSFPRTAPAQTCLIRFGDAQPISTYGTYRFWMTQATLNSWIGNPVFSDEPYPGTVVYGNFRVIYGGASHYSSSPAHRKLMDSPIGTNADFELLVPDDDLLLNENGLRIQQPGLFGNDTTGQDEQMCWWLIGEMDIPSTHRRSIVLFMNGQRRRTIYEDVQREGSDYIAEWFPKSNGDGDLYKIQYWYEFSDDLGHHSDTLPSLVPVLSGGVKKLARYRQSFARRAFSDSAHNYTNLFNLVDLLNTTATGDAYIAQVVARLDITNWARAFAAERIINNTDLYGAKRLLGDIQKPGGQNAFLFLPDGDTWKWLVWDIDAALTGLPTDPLFDFTDSPISNLFLQPLVLRTYWQALEDAANGPLVRSNLDPLPDAKYAAYLASGVNVIAPQASKDFLTARRDYILWLFTQVNVNFAITSNGGNNFTNPTTLFTLSGVAPIFARTITINGIAYPLSWSSETNWSFQLALTGQTNQFVVQGYDAQGNPLSKYNKGITVYYNGPVSRPQDSLVFSEIMYRPAVSNASYVEIYNRSTNTAISLYNYRLHGIDFDFPATAFLNPLSSLVVVQDPVTFQAIYGTNARIAGTYNGNLDPDGETLSLVKQGLTTNDADVVINKVKYEARTPWSTRAAATNSGASLQLIDPAQDNARVSNWDDGANWRYKSFTGIPGGSSPTRLYIYISDAAGDVYLDDIKLVLGTVAEVGSNYVRNGDFEAPFTGSWSNLTSSGTPTSVVTNTFVHSGSNSMHLTFSKAGSTTICMYEDLAGLNTSLNYTLSFWYRPTNNATGTNLTVRVGSSAFSPSVGLRPILATPGTTNSVAATVQPYPLLWINEVQPNNATGIQDNTGARQPWIELFNSGTNDITLDGLSLSKNYTNLNQWAFPTGTVIHTGEFRVLFVDGQSNLSVGTVLHASFRLDPTNGSIILSRGGQILDYINYTNMTPDLSYGSSPDGQLFDRQVFYFVTPGASNNPAPIPVAINEWMASNTHTMVNPANGKYDDWFELYNFGAATINLSGYFLTDNLGNKNMFRIPAGTLIAPYSFLLCWADNSVAATNTIGNAIHATFALSKGGDKIGLFSPGGIQVDAISFGSQTSDVSQGRFPDGNVNGVYYFMPTVTPRTNNVITNNVYAPVLSAIPDYSIAEGALLTFTAHATDADVPAQTVSYSLLAGAPDGASINPLTGVFTWTPSETHGGAVYPITVVANDNAGPPLTDSKTFHVTVTEVNNPPGIGPIPDQTVAPNNLVSVSVPASDSDLPPQTLGFSLLSAPPGANVDANGLFTWTPSQGPSTNPIVVRVTDNGSPSLSATQGFTVFVTAGIACEGIKGDIAPRAVGGNGFVNFADWIQIGNFAARIDAPTNACESAKADCAPAPCGDGLISLADWVQAGLYWFGVQPPVFLSECSPAPAPLLAQAALSPKSVSPKSPPDGRSLIVSNIVIEHGQSGCLQVYLNSQGDENALCFGLSFNTNLLTLVSAGPSADYPDAFVNTNLLKLTNGQLGIALALLPGTTFSSGLQAAVEICFQAADVVNATSAPVTLVDNPLPREAVDGNAQDLPLPGSQDGTVSITGGGSGVPISFESITPMGGGQVKLVLTGPSGGVFHLQGSSNLVNWNWIADLTNTTGRLEYLHSASTNGPPRFYRTIAP